MGDSVPGMPPTFTPNKPVKKLVGRKIAAITENKYVFWFIFSAWYWRSSPLMISSSLKKKSKVSLIRVTVLTLWRKRKCWLCARATSELR
ncbi:Uncharacterised protein [Vibrio cholerae]|nr:Uncharacterised protein [Vibrio cholerae]CSD47474.1 Uncharacterised protein [Vibrio cholerae]